MAIEKCIRKDLVGVIYSPGFGAGWYSWNSYKYGIDIIFDKDLVEAIDAKNIKLTIKIAEEKYPEAYTGGLDNARIAWLPKGTKFIIREYDGSESIQIVEHIEFFVA